MSSGTQDVLDKIFAALSGDGMGSGGGGLAGIVTAGLAGGGSNAAAGSKQSQPNAAASIGMEILTSGLGLVPLVGSLLGLFGGGGADTPAPLTKYALPPSIEFQGAEAGAGIVEADYYQSGTARSFSQVTNSGAGTRPLYGQEASGGAGVPASNPQPAGPAAGASSGQPYINVTVQAMDARSFLDRSSDIAAAVRDAMLNLNSINDVVNDL
jgi:hypothetical protein